MVQSESSRHAETRGACYLVLLLWLTTWFAITLFYCTEEMPLS